MRTLIALAASVALAGAAMAATDIELPQASPAASVSLAVGTTKVKLDYHRPGVKGREIWGGLVPYDTIWRLGANEATTIDFDDPVRIAGQAVPKGKYALFAIPGKESWTIILNRKSGQWGAYYHNQADDQIRFTVKPEPAPFTEWMVFTLSPTGPGTAEVAMTWEKLRVTFPIEVDVPAIVWAEITSELAEKDVDWEDYFAAAQSSLDQGGHKDEALGWAEKAMAGKPSFWTFELKARVLHRAGRTTEALPLLDQAMADARGKAPQEYIDGLARMKADWDVATKK
jgi:tetratricopeptide (TPR) repeat protein